MQNKTENQNLIEGWHHSLLAANDESLPFTVQDREELEKIMYLARLGAWYHKHQHVLDHMIQNTLAVMEMEVHGNPHFYKAIENCKAMQAEKPIE